MPGICDNCDPGEPGEDTSEDQKPKPPASLVRWWNRFIYVFSSPHAPHWVIAVLTGVLALFAWKAWDESMIGTQALQGQIVEARRQANVAEDTEKRSLRAYVGVKVLPFGTINPFVPPNIPDVHIQQINHGRTPAYETIYQGYVNGCEYPMPKNFDFTPSEAIPETNPNPVTIYPGEPDYIGIHIAGKRPLTSEEFASMTDGKYRLCFWGTITYNDAFQIVRHTNFCYSFFGTTTLINTQPCEQHNDSD